MIKILQNSELKRAKLLLKGFDFNLVRIVNRTSDEDYSYIDGKIVKAGLSPNEKRHFLFFTLIGVSFFMALGFINATFIIGIIFVLFLSLIYLNSRIYKRVESFEKDYAPFLISLSAGVKTGVDSFSALVKCAELFPDKSEIRKEIKLLEERLEKGFSENASLAEFARDVEHPDIDLFKIAFLLARKEGSSLSQSLQRLARVTRQRQSFRRKVKAALILQKFSAIGIAGCTLIIMLMQFLSNPKMISETFSHSLGKPLMITGLSLVLIGLVWMLSLSKSRI